MMNIVINGNKIKNMDDFHNEIKNLLNLPSYYGNNLDALDECLDDYDNLTFTFINSSKLAYNLEKYFFILLDLLKDHNIDVKIKVNE